MTVDRSGRNSRWRRLPLRDRITFAFAVGALALSALLSGVTWSLTRNYLVERRESSAIAQAEAHAGALSSGLAAGDIDVPQLLSSVAAGAEAPIVLRIRGSWYASTLAAGAEQLPAELTDRVAGGASATQRVEIDGSLRLVVGLSLNPETSMFEVFAMQELDRSLTVLSLVLLAGSASVTALGAGLGRWASSRALRPLDELRSAAGAMAQGQWETRLQGDDPDTAAIAASFNETAAALQERVRRDARFAADVSHELRSPVTTMLNAAELLESCREDLPGRGQEALDLLHADLRRFRQLVEDLLEITRPEGSLVLEDTLLGEFVGRAADRAATRPVTQVLPGAEHAVICADRRRLERVVANLVLNAEVHGGGVTRVAVSTAGGRGQVAVEDAGAGVPPQRRQEIFERFTRGPDAGSRLDQAGVGLGLALVARHVRLHAGQVRVEDRPGGGARFVVELPLTPPPR